MPGLDRSIQISQSPRLNTIRRLSPKASARRAGPHFRRDLASLGVRGAVRGVIVATLALKCRSRSQTAHLVAVALPDPRAAHAEPTLVRTTRATTSLVEEICTCDVSHISVIHPIDPNDRRAAMSDMPAEDQPPPSQTPIYDQVASEQPDAAADAAQATEVPDTPAGAEDPQG